MVPKNSGLKKYKEIALSELDSVLKGNSAEMIEARAEDIPFWIELLQKKGKNGIGLIGEDLFEEYCLKKGKSKIKIIKRIEWIDSKALYKKPALCLLGPKEKDLSDLPKNLTVCISAKYREIAKKYLKSLEKKGFSFNKIYFNGCCENTYFSGLSDLVVDIVYSGSSMKKFGLKVFDKLLQSDFLIIGGAKND